MDEFSRRHEGQLAQLITMAPDLGQHPQAQSLPLLGISAEPSQTSGTTITISAASPKGLHISHEIPHPTHLWLAEWNDGISGQVEIEAEDGFVASISVGPQEQVLPPGAMLDGNYRRD